MRRLTGMLAALLVVALAAPASAATTRSVRFASAYMVNGETVRVDGYYRCEDGQVVEGHVTSEPTGSVEFSGALTVPDEGYVIPVGGDGVFTYSATFELADRTVVVHVDSQGCDGPRRPVTIDRTVIR